MLTTPRAFLFVVIGSLEPQIQKEVRVFYCIDIKIKVAPDTK